MPGSLALSARLNAVGSIRYPSWLVSTYPALISSINAAANYDTNNYWVRGKGEMSVEQFQTCTRAQTGSTYVLNSASVYVPCAANTNRRSDLGDLIEQASTNSVPNNSMTGAVVGTIGSGGVYPTFWSQVWSTSGAGMSQAVIGMGTEFGLPYIDIRVFGTPTGAGEAWIMSSANPAAAQGQTWTSSWFVRLTNSSPTGVSRIVTQGFGGGVDLAVTTFSPTSAIQRPMATRTFTDAATSNFKNYIQFVLTQNIAVDFTVRLYAPQAEQLASATSPILTTNATVTRAADSVSPSAAVIAALQVTSGWMLVKTPLGIQQINSYLVTREQSNANDVMMQAGSTTTGRVFVNGAGFASATIGSAGTWSGSVRAGITWGAGGINVALNGGTVAKTATLFSSNPSADPFIGSRNGSTGTAFPNGFYSRLAVGGGPMLSDAQLQALVA